NDASGDGTTTAVLLGQSMIRKGFILNNLKSLIEKRKNLKFKNRLINVKNEEKSWVTRFQINLSEKEDNEGKEEIFDIS
ncbi:MAG: hypothetical protein Q8768_02370, partial [Candidatus Phytoplasma australasiaticum]|nr:hypothetical protein [Candidatus Phytoplasma australasiaticum]